MLPVISWGLGCRNTHTNQPNLTHWIKNSNKRDVMEGHWVDVELIGCIKKQVWRIGKSQRKLPAQNSAKVLACKFLVSPLLPLLSFCCWQKILNVCPHQFLPPKLTRCRFLLNGKQGLDAAQAKYINVLSTWLKIYLDHDFHGLYKSILLGVQV